MCTNLKDDEEIEQLFSKAKASRFYSQEKQKG